MLNDKHSEEFLIEKAVKMTFQKLYDKGLFDNYDNANDVLKDFFLSEVNERRRLDLEEVKYIIQRVIQKCNLKNKATSKSKCQKVLSSLPLNDVGIFLRDSPFSSDFKIGNIQPSQGVHVVLDNNQCHFDSHVIAPPINLSKLIVKRKG